MKLAKNIKERNQLGLVSHFHGYKSLPLTDPRYIVGDLTLWLRSTHARAHHVGHNAKKLLTNRHKHSCSSLLSSHGRPTSLAASKTQQFQGPHRKKRLLSVQEHVREVQQGRFGGSNLATPNVSPTPPHPVSTPNLNAFVDQHGWLLLGAQEETRGSLWDELQ